MKYLMLLPSLFLLCITGCSVAPVLESPRIKPGVKCEVDVFNMQNEIQWNLSDSIMRGGIYSNKLKFQFGESPLEYAPKLLIGISDRVELGGYLWWLFLNGGWDVKIKINVLDAGKDVMFRNIGMALIAGFKGYYGEWSGANRTWAGITLGTLHKINSVELEYIIMPTVGFDHFNNFDDGLGSGGVAFTDIMINTGVSVFLSQRLYASCAAVLSVLESEFSYSNKNYTVPSPQINEITFTPQKVGFNFNLGWRFGGGMANSGQSMENRGAQ